MSDGFSITYSEDWTTMHQRLTLFTEKVAKQATLAALKETAKVMRNSAKQKVSRSSENHMLKVAGKYVEISPGNLLKEIRFRKIRKENTDPGELRYQVYVKIKYAWYAKFLEFGTSKMAAQPFMRPAFEENAALLPEIFNQKVLRFISEGGF